MADIKSLQIANVGEDVGKKGNTCTAGGNVTSYSCYGKEFGLPCKTKNEIPYDPEISLLIYI